MTNARIGERIGRAIARDTLAEKMPHDWTGIDAQDGDQFQLAGIAPDTPEWREAEAEAELAFRTAIAKAT